MEKEIVKSKEWEIMSKEERKSTEGGRKGK